MVSWLNKNILGTKQSIYTIHAKSLLLSPLGALILGFQNFPSFKFLGLS